MIIPCARMEKNAFVMNIMTPGSSKEDNLIIIDPHFLRCKIRALKLNGHRQTTITLKNYGLGHHSSNMCGHYAKLMTLEKFSAITHNFEFKISNIPTLCGRENHLWEFEVRKTETK